MTYILGLNAYHGDSSACLVHKGQLVAAAEEERFRRIKHWAGFPSEAIRYCLAEAGISLKEVDHVAVNRDPQANWGPRLRFIVTKRPSIAKLVNRLKNHRKMRGIEAGFAEQLPGDTLRARVHNVQHHLAHLVSASHVSPFDTCVALSVDQFGDFASSAWGICRGTQVEVDDSVYFPHSLGTFYSALTQYIGFPHFGDEYKLMGLAPYGKPVFLDALREVVRTTDNGKFELDLRFFRHHKDKIEFEWNNAAPSTANLFSDELDKLLGPRRQKGDALEQRHRDLARSVQARYEEVFFHILNHLHQRYGVDDLALAGGCAMNSVANGKIHANTPFRNVYIQSAAGDAGGALGAAFAVWYELDGGPRRFVMNHALWGPGFGADVIDQMLTEHHDEVAAQNCSIEVVEDEKLLCEKTAQAVADGKVIGWFQGRMEWGPRALGNRSIVCDPRRADMKEILNQKIKRRESFRPFAPSILREEAAQWFEHDDEVPFMMKVFQIRAEKRELIPAVTHVDGSGRLQTVREEVNPRYHRLIRAFADLTGVPLVLNTSFNENEPVVCTPTEALQCFLRTKMDLLVLGDRMIYRKAAPADGAS